jgi:hypothetical protein
MPDTRIKVSASQRGIIFAVMLSDFVAGGFPDSVGGTA